MKAPDTSDFKALFERVSDPAIVVEDETGRVAAANLSFVALAAQPSYALKGRELKTLVVPDGGEDMPGAGRGRLLLGGGQASLPVALESFPCRWGEGGARVYLVKADAADIASHGAHETERLYSLFNYFHEATEQLEAVNRIVAAVNSSSTIEGVFQLASEQIRALVPFGRASVALLEDDGETLRVFALSGEQPGSLAVGARGKLRGSVTEMALDEKRMVVIPELRAETRFNTYDDLRREDFRSAVSVPLFSTRGAVGSLNLTSRTPDAYRRKHLLALERLAPPLAIAIEKILLLESSHRRAEELRGLFEISRLFSALTDTSEISGRLSRAIANLVGGAMCLIATYDRRTNTVRAESNGFNTPAELVREFHFTLERGNTSAPVYLTGEAFRSNDPANDPRLNRGFVERWGIHSVLSVPMTIKRELIGFIYVANRAGGFGERELRMLEIFAAQAAETIVNSRLFLTIQAQAEREAVVNRLLLSLQRDDEPRDKVRAVIERVGEVLGLDRCVAVLFADGEHEDYYGEWCADGVEPVTGWADVRERSPVPHALRTARRPIAAPDVRRHPLSEGLGDLVERMQLKSFLVVPVMHRGRVIGSISGHQTRSYREWSEDDVDLLVAVATHVGATLENARLINELREANRLKDQFLATLSHELRTPLTAISGWIEMLGEKSLLGASPDVADGIQAIRASATALTQLISDLLDLSRIQRGVLSLNRELLDINRLVSDAARDMRQTVAARKLDLRLELAEELPPTVADSRRVRQVLWNLLSNAIKFTPARGQITVRTRAVGEGAMSSGEVKADGGVRWIEVEVEDTGQGIPAEFMPFIWERFRQADASSTRRHGGLGIGLSLVRELVEAHGGQVEAFSEGRGARFTVRLPVVGAESLHDQGSHVETRAGDARPHEFN